MYRRNLLCVTGTGLRLFRELDKRHQGSLPRHDVSFATYPTSQGAGRCWSYLLRRAARFKLRTR